MISRLPDVTIKVIEQLGINSMGVLIDSPEQLPAGEHHYTPHSKLQEAEAVNKDLATLVMRLCSKLKKYEPENKTVMIQAMNYLSGHGFHNNLRSTTNE